MDTRNYPMGADNEYAPWNEIDNIDRKFTIEVNQELSKVTTIWTNQYQYDDGDVDYNSVNYSKEFENQHYTPLQLIQKFREMLVAIQEKTFDEKKFNIDYLIQECNDWDSPDDNVNADVCL